ncbi:hypothetical protein HME9304_01797 [Flagellimonas maritima]|uniref:Conjugative transposon protein TraO n=1 Tax=Flagellimonas maritima TaxID=1383885 RepID=A0A2Z4LST8_9FLAO|nr:conjugal transfer protein TraO [Allomuricauda aurantiaca]AWX44792.1 hypothetical protein HME9304_01797 [Allomuricauda aurantiaca]
MKIMRKNGLAFAFLLFTGLASLQGQRSKTAVEFAPGYAQEGFGIKGAFNYYHNRTDYLHANILATFSKEKTSTAVTVPYNIFLFNAAYFTPVIKSKDNSNSLYTGGGISLGYESINGNEPDLEDNSLLVSESGLLYGFYGGINADYFLSDSFSLILPIDLFYHFGSDLGNIHFFTGLGVRYHIN